MNSHARNSQNLVKHMQSSTFLVRSNHCRHQSTELLTTQTDQSKRDILIDYVLITHSMFVYNSTVKKVIWKGYSKNTNFKLHGIQKCKRQT